MKRIFSVLAMLCPLMSMCQLITIKGKIFNEQMEPTAGATIAVKGSNKTTASNSKGEFTLTEMKLFDTLIVSSVGYETQEVPNNERGLITVILKKRIGLLDEAVVIAYGTTTRRLNTGSVAKLSADEIARQPVSNPLAALAGRVPGLTITQTSGVPGAGYTVQVRGRNSIAQGSEPLFIIDGVPFAPGNQAVNQLFSAAAPNAFTPGLSAFNSINPADIESIEVLKDADATAIYGSRGANGVVLITTKKAAGNKTGFSLNASTGIARTTRSMRMMNTPQYLQMRREAFANDGVTPTSSTATDLLVWDTTRYTDFRELLTGGTARTADLQATLSGGSALTRYYVGGGYHHETTVFPGEMAAKRRSLNIQLNHSSSDRRFTIRWSSLYSLDKNNLVSANLAAAITLPPNLPALYDSAGHLAWSAGGVSFTNPLAYLLQEYTAETDNTVNNLKLGYQLLKGLSLQASLGYNTQQVDETSLLPKASRNPATNPEGSASFASGSFKSWIAEPQIHYNRKIGKGTLESMVGATWQHQDNEGTSTSASGYVNDALLSSLSAAAATFSKSYSNQYRYTALFGRLNYNWQSRYIVNLTGRHDGSSRFGPGKRFTSFGAIGAAWLFSNERWLQQHLPLLSYGKLRGSYGSSGNDQIGDYKYLDTYGPAPYSYAGSAGLVPTRLYNPDYNWEVNKKLEAALETGFWKDRVLLTAAFFRNRCGNQLISYVLPAQTGFTSVFRNFPGVVENKGWEFTLATQNLQGRKLEWTTSAHVTIARNKLVSFPGIETSSYSSLYVVGEPLSVVNSYHYLGVDTETGVYRFEDINHDGSITSRDKAVSGHQDPLYYGGISNSFRHKSLQLHVFVEFKKQLGNNYMASFDITPPGTMTNRPETVTNRWHQPGDEAAHQRATRTGSSAAYKAQSLFAFSDGVIGDASYIRLKNLAVSWSFPTSWTQKLALSSCRLYTQAQNLLTITRYKGGDPETQSLTTLPPLRVATAGIQLTF